MDSPAYALRVFEERARQAGVFETLSGKCVLELGPGDSIASAVVAKSYGARAILLDAGSFVKPSVVEYQGLVSLLPGNGLSDLNPGEWRDVQGVLGDCDALYLTNGLEDLKVIPSQSVDYIFSQAVLEHVRKNELFETLVQCRRVLTPNGVCSHQVDLRDHLGGALNNLRIRENFWESSLFASSGFYTNRIRFDEMLGLFKCAGFSVEVFNIKRWSELPTAKRNMTVEFQSLSVEQLSISQFDVVLR